MAIFAPNFWSTESFAPEHWFGVINRAFLGWKVGSLVNPVWGGPTGAIAGILTGGDYKKTQGLGKKKSKKKVKRGNKSLRKQRKRKLR